MSITLYLSKFKNRDTFYTLPDKGLVKLDGPSGVGKSNIFKGIFWGLYGKGRNVTMYGEKGCSVELKGLAGMDVKRTHNPNLLTVENFTNDGAQKRIEETLGMNFIEFESSSYVMQDQKNSLISLSPLDQLELINSLTFKTGSPEDTKEIIKEFIRGTQVESSDLDRQIKELERESRELKENINTYTEFLVDDQPGVLRTQIKDLESQIELKENIRKLTKAALDKKKEQRDNPARKIVTSNLKRFHDLMAEARDLEQWLNDPANEPVEIPPEMREEKKRLVARYTELVPEVSALKKYREENRSATELASLVQSYREQVYEAAHSLPEDFQVTDAADLRLLIMDYEQGQAAMEDALGSAQANKIVLEYNQICTEISDIKEKEAAYQGQKALYDSKKTKHIANLNEMVSLKSRLPPLDQIILDEELDNFINELTRQELEIKNAALRLTREKEDLETKLKAAERSVHLKGKIELARLRMITIEDEINALVAKADRYTNEIADANKLIELANKAALDSVEHTISELNVRSQYWQDVVFGGSIQVTMETFKELKSKKEGVDKLNLSIYEGPNKIDKKEELSGGQQSRLCLAFQLALSDMYNSPILMLDEAFKGVDADTMRVCFEALKEIAERKLVLVIEHFAPNHYFHEVIDIT